jgi:Fur family transcriptional regulator, ferric uptake regulator
MNQRIPGQLRNTRQRDAIVAVLADATGPLTVEELHRRSQAIVPGIGIATVYRTLKLLVDAGSTLAVTLPSGETRYESSQRGHHHHFQCLICDTVYDFHSCPLSLRRDTPGADFTVEHHELTLFGTCPTCQ